MLSSLAADLAETPKLSFRTNAVRAHSSRISSQGAFIKRHELKNQDGSQLRFGNISVGSNLDLYGKVVHITDADNATRAFMQQQSLPQGPAEPYPTGPYDQVAAGRTHSTGESSAMLLDKKKLSLHHLGVHPQSPGDSNVKCPDTRRPFTQCGRQSSEAGRQASSSTMHRSTRCSCGSAWS